MTWEATIETLGYAAAHDLRVRVITDDGAEFLGTPTSVDVHPASLEVYLRPLGQDDGEVAVSLARVSRVELL